MVLPNFSWLEEPVILDVEFPHDISENSEGSTTFQTAVTQVDSGFEQRLSRWDEPIMEYNVAYGVRTMEQLHDLMAMFRAAKGQLFAFLYKDYWDFTSSFASGVEARVPDPITNLDQILVPASGTDVVFEVQMIKTYTLGSTTAVRTVTKPVSGTVVVALDGSPLVETTDYTIDYTTGIISFVQATALALTNAQMEAPTSTTRVVIHDSGDSQGSLGVGDFVFFTGFALPGNVQPQSEAWTISTIVAGRIDLALPTGRDQSIGVQEGVTVTASDISFTAPDLIDSAGSDFGIFSVGQFIRVEGSAGQDGVYEIATQSAAQLELVEQTITTEGSGASMTITDVVTSGVDMNQVTGVLPTEELTAGYEFRVPVRFAVDKLPVSIDAFGIGSASDVKLREIRLFEE